MLDPPPFTRLCHRCPKNHFRPTWGATSCLKCPKGTQTTGTGNTECTPCPVGYYNDVVGGDCKPARPGNFVNTTGAYWATSW